MDQEAQHRLGSFVKIARFARVTFRAGRTGRQDHPPSLVQGLLASSYSFDFFLPLCCIIGYSSQLLLLRSFLLPVRILFFCQRVVSSSCFFLLNYFSFKIQRRLQRNPPSDLISYTTDQSTKYTPNYRSTKQCLIEIGITNTANHDPGPFDGAITATSPHLQLSQSRFGPYTPATDENGRIP